MQANLEGEQYDYGVAIHRRQLPQGREKYPYRRPINDTGPKYLRKIRNLDVERLRLARTLVIIPAARGRPRY